MGGKLFNLGRLPKPQYLQIEANIKIYLEAKMPLAYHIPRYYASKADFGDMDIIVAPSLVGKDWQTLTQEIVTDLAITQYKNVSNIFSTVYQNFQVDFFCVKDQFLESTYNYLSFNDLGNLLGRICKRFNLKYGEQGLLYVYRREEGNYNIDLPVTTDFKQICAFLGLAYPVWEAGFDNLEQLFEWVIASPYFSVEPYLHTHQIEKRAKNRPTIERFLAYLQEKQIDKRYEFDEEKTAYLPQIIAFFQDSNLAYLIEAEEAKEARTIAIQSKFSGKLVMQLIPDLRGRDLGLFILEFKQQFADNETFEEFILT
jgi:hypothetical protein